MTVLSDDKEKLGQDWHEERKHCGDSADAGMRKYCGDSVSAGMREVLWRHCQCLLEENTV